MYNKIESIANRRDSLLCLRYRTFKIFVRKKNSGNVTTFNIPNINNIPLKSVVRWRPRWSCSL